MISHFKILRSLFAVFSTNFKLWYPSIIHRYIDIIMAYTNWSKFNNYIITISYINTMK